MAIYPNAIPTIAQVFQYTDDVDWMNAAKWTVMRNELIAIATELGTLPKGAYATVKARLDALVGGYTDRGDPAAFDFDKNALTADGTWRDLDLSSIVPVGTKGVALMTYIVDDLVGSILDLRKNGNSNDKNVGHVRTQVAGEGIDNDMIIACDTDRKLEYRLTNTVWTAIYITVKGWWM